MLSISIKSITINNIIDTLNICMEVTVFLLNIFRFIEKHHIDSKSNKWNT